MKAFFTPLVHFLFHLGVLGPFFMGIMDSSFLVLPFGNDLLVVGMVVHRPHDAPWYVLSAASGSSVGAFLLASVSKKLGETGIVRVFGKRRYEKLKTQLGQRFAIAVAMAGLAPPPFPFTLVIAAAGALGYSRARLFVVNFFARGTRFIVLALRYGRDIIYIFKSQTFEWSMVAIVALCIVATGFSAFHWLRKPLPKPARSHAAD